MPIRNMTKAEALQKLKGLRLQAENIQAIEQQWLDAVGNVLGSKFHTRMYAESALANEIKYLERYPDASPTSQEVEEILRLLENNNGQV